MTLTKVDHARAREVVDALHGAFITGSYLVNRETANDIDIVVPHGGWLHARAVGVGDTYHEQEALYVAGARFVKQEPEGESDNYTSSEDGMYELVEHWRNGGLNILVIRENFIPAYKAAAYYIESNPRAFQTREQRVEIHQRMKGEIREMLRKAAEGDEIPW